MAAPFTLVNGMGTILFGYLKWRGRWGRIVRVAT
jgi:hypothetical protein